MVCKYLKIHISFSKNRWIFHRIFKHTRSFSIYSWPSDSFSEVESSKWLQKAGQVQSQRKRTIYNISGSCLDWKTEDPYLHLSASPGWSLLSWERSQGFWRGATRILQISCISFQKLVVYALRNIDRWTRVTIVRQVWNPGRSNR